MFSYKASPILALLTVSLCLLTISTKTALAQNTTQFHATGVGVTGVLDSGNNTTINVEVVRNGSPGQSNESTFMLLDYFNETSTSFTEIVGGGNIPNGDLTGDSTGHMALSADLSQLTGFTSCTTDFTNNNTVTCTNNPTGMISMSWQTRGFGGFTAISQFSRETLNLSGMTLLLISDNNSTDAVASGTAFGQTFSSGYGHIDTFRSFDLTLQRKQ